MMQPPLNGGKFCLFVVCVQPMRAMSNRSILSLMGTNPSAPARDIVAETAMPVVERATIINDIN